MVKRSRRQSVAETSNDKDVAEDTQEQTIRVQHLADDDVEDDVVGDEGRQEPQNGYPSDEEGKDGEPPQDVSETAEDDDQDISEQVGGLSESVEEAVAKAISALTASEAHKLLDKKKQKAAEDKAATAAKKATHSSSVAGASSLSQAYAPGR